MPDQPDERGPATGHPPREPGLRTTTAGIADLDETERWLEGAAQSCTYWASRFRQRSDTLGAGE
ncbi:MAG: hypothetical protein IT376_11865 [Polyangiaceae bacterium]|nr:hypothetical protein [Polyangiaceae bacterium]